MPAIAVPTPATSPRYLAPGRFTRRVFNPAVARLAKWGVSVTGTRLLDVPGRQSGVVRTTVVNVLDHDGDRYLVAPRGTTQWVRNLRAADGVATLRLGGRHEPIAAVELADADKVAVLRAYLAAWAWEVGQFFPGLSAHSPASAIEAAAPGFPVFRL